MPDNVEVYTYEVNVNQKAPAVDFVFRSRQTEKF